MADEDLCAKFEWLECSVWNNGGTGWGVKVLGGTRVRATHFDRNVSTVIVQIDGVDVPCNIDKKSFWTRTCGELIEKRFGEFFRQQGLQPGDRVWLEIVEPKRRFRLQRDSDQAVGEAPRHVLRDQSVHRGQAEDAGADVSEVARADEAVDKIKAILERWHGDVVNTDREALLAICAAVGLVLGKPFSYSWKQEKAALADLSRKREDLLREIQNDMVQAVGFVHLMSRERADE